jgi:hypothetical protein
LGGTTGVLPWGIFIFVLGFIWLFYFQKKKAQALLLFMLVILPICFYVFCNHIFRISVAPRYFLIVYPFFLLTAAAGIASFPSLAGRIAGTFVFLLPLCLYVFFQADRIPRFFIPNDYLLNNMYISALPSMVKRNNDALDFVVVKPKHAIFFFQYYLDKANRSPVVQVRGIFGKQYFICKNSKILLLGSEGDLPLLKYLSSAGRLLVIDFSQGTIAEGDNVILPWLKSNASRMRHFFSTDLYYFAPPRIAGDYKDSLATVLRKLLDARVLRRWIYPFNRKEWVLREN